MTYEGIVFDTTDGIATIRFNNPEKLNALTFQTYADLERIMEDLARDDAVDVVMITGTGRAFCSGGSVHDIAAGAGAALMLAADLRIFSEQARAAFLFVKVGLSGADMGALYLLPRIVGLGKATELIYFGDTIDAQEAYRIGLANRVVPAESLISETRKWSLRLKDGPRHALGVTKALFESEANLELEPALEMEAQAQAQCMQTSDFREGFNAFVEKR